MKQIFEQLISKQDLNREKMQTVMRQCLNGTLSDLQLATFLALMRMKGETFDELVSAALVLQDMAHTIDLGSDLIDIVGTGGDGKNTFNVSTVSSFVVAGAGLRVAKHGNHATSSRSGSADLLLSAGFVLDLPDETLRYCMDQCHMAFLFGPHFHQAMCHARRARQQLGIRTLFNLLGPLLNPARVTKQVVGVYGKQWLRPIATVLAELGSEHALVIHSADGLDEISIAAKTEVQEFKNGQFTHWTLDPNAYGLYHATLDDIIVQTPEQSLAKALTVFAGEPGPARDIVVLNAAAAIYCADKVAHYEEALLLAKEAIDSGRAAACFHQLRDLTQTKKPTIAPVPPNSILESIATQKKEEVRLAKKERPLTSLQDGSAYPLRDFTAALRAKKPALITEIKRASPSQGLLRQDFDVTAIAKVYASHGAACLSVLTDIPFFKGDPSYLALAKAACALPVLRKDFIIDAYQIHESRALGADCILLIVALLDDQQLHDYCQLAEALSMAVLVESHTRKELERALRLPTPLIGINNRSLHTFKTDLQCSIELAALVPADKLLITESGIKTHADILTMQAQGIHTFLVGETLMRAENVGEALDLLLHDTKNPNGDRWERGDVV